MIKLLSALLSLAFSFFAFSQNLQYELKGSYKLQSSMKRPVDYTLQWTEAKKGTIEGTYSDNYFVQNAKVRGDVADTGRTFIVEFPGPKKGVGSLVILTSLTKNVDAGTERAVSIITRDIVGGPLTTVKTTSRFNLVGNQNIAQRQEENNCVDGFGVLSGFCGIYSGMLSEEVDRRNKCNLLYADAARLELTPDSTLILHLGETSDLVTPAYHSIGRIPADPQKDSVDVLSRVCGALVGVNSSSDRCKILHLTGRFSREGRNQHFQGKYEITEEETNNLCRYGISMDKQFAP